MRTLPQVSVTAKDTASHISDRTAKDTARRRVESSIDALLALSHRIHAHPELAYEEEQSAAWCIDALAADSRFRIVPGAGGIPTAFTATTGSGPLHVGICAEYDALPGIGHACGHNVIAASAVGAGLALASLADDLGLTVTVFGCPAEEGAGGKIKMLDAGLFDGVHAAMMVHPAPTEADRMHCLAVVALRRALPRAYRARLGLPTGGRQRGRCDHRRAGRGRSAASAHPADGPHPRHRDQGRRRAEHRPRSRPR